MSKNENKLNKINSQIFNENEGFEDNNFLETSQNQSRNKKKKTKKKITVKFQQKKYYKEYLH